MRGYFIAAAKETLRGEGLRAVSARNIAAKAGYSYATLYNYFKDVNNLIFECVVDFQRELSDTAEQAAAAAEPGEERLKAGLTAWLNYFIQYPGIFELFFLERMGDFGNMGETAEVIRNSIESAASPGIDDLINGGRFNEEDRNTLIDVLRFNLTGLILYYSNRRYPPDYPSLISEMKNQIELILSLPAGCGGTH